uniref:Uncharacterized protein n=1 Tax=Arundo donax TaxID=35708 RepID=A0A0A8Y4P4_ARUDO
MRPTPNRGGAESKLSQILSLDNPILTLSRASGPILLRSWRSCSCGRSLESHRAGKLPALLLPMPIRCSPSKSN